MIFTHQRTAWDGTEAAASAAESTRQLESGGILRLPVLAFAVNPDERVLFTPKILSGDRKNASYDLGRDKLAGVPGDDPLRPLLQGLMRRYAEQSRQLVNALLPHYTPALVQGRTSFRPVEIEGRISSVKKDDTRLHVDAFPATPLQGRRILRVFTNMNPDGKPRHWRTGESFGDVAKRFSAGLSPSPGAFRRLLQAVKITKSYRTAYDDLMLQTHDSMKMDEAYQASVPREDIHFQPCETWVVYSDQVSHAALSGQHLLEQTFYLEARAMLDPEQSPLRQLERLKHQPLLV